MNIVGKILVIVNMVFALLVAGFLVIDFATRTNYKTYSDKLKAELDIARANTQTGQDTNRKLLDEKKAVEDNLSVLQKTFENTKLEYNATLDRAKQQAQDEKKKAEIAQFTSQRALAENTRLQAEAKDLTGLVKKREEMIRTLQDDSNKYHTEALANEQKAKAANEHALNLLEKVRQLELDRVREAQKQTGTTPTASTRSPDYRNPPAAYVKGVIKQVDGSDPNRGQISIGSDEGLKDGNTLMVYRLNPQPEYIGTIVLRDVDHHSAVGKLLPSSTGAQKRGLKVGDEVASRIFR
jgi:multidrug efflux pump subunit AcrA (membrane-fusion protein)